MYKGLCFRLYPNKEQKILMAKTFGCCRLIYNKGLELRKETYAKTGKGIGYTQTAKLITKLKKTTEYAFLEEVSTVALQQALRDLDNSYTRFFNHLGGYPKRKKKSDSRQSFRIVNQIPNGKPKVYIITNADVNGSGNIMRKVFPKVRQWGRGIVDMPCAVIRITA